MSHATITPVSATMEPGERSMAPPPEMMTKVSPIAKRPKIAICLPRA